MHKQRLMNVVRALRESPNPDKFDMGKTHHKCGAPACAIGHYVSRQDLQDEFKPVVSDSEYFDGDGTAYIRKGDIVIFFDNRSMRDHFDLDGDEFGALFGGGGCGGAKTATRAADVIQHFVETGELPEPAEVDCDDDGYCDRDW
jgi:hypothetical protein